MPRELLYGLKKGDEVVLHIKGKQLFLKLINHYQGQTGSERTSQPLSRTPLDLILEIFISEYYIEPYKQEKSTKESNKIAFDITTTLEKVDSMKKLPVELLRLTADFCRPLTASQFIQASRIVNS